MSRLVNRDTIYIYTHTLILVLLSSRVSEDNELRTCSHPQKKKEKSLPAHPNYSVFVKAHTNTRRSTELTHSQRGRERERERERFVVVFFYSVSSRSLRIGGWKWWRWLWISTRWERSSSRFSRSSLRFIASSPPRKRSLERRELRRRWTASPRPRPLTENVDPLTPLTPTLSSSVLASPAPLSLTLSARSVKFSFISFSLLSFSATKQCLKLFFVFFLNYEKSAKVYGFASTFGLLCAFCLGN